MCVSWFFFFWPFADGVGINPQQSAGISEVLIIFYLNTLYFEIEQLHWIDQKLDMLCCLLIYLHCGLLFYWFLRQFMVGNKQFMEFLFLFGLHILGLAVEVMVLDCILYMLQPVIWWHVPCSPFPYWLKTSWFVCVITVANGEVIWRRPLLKCSNF